MSTIDAFNNVVNMEDGDSEEENEDNIEIDLEVENDTFACDECEFTTEKKTGLKIHKSKVHVKVKCGNCYREFSSREELFRHVEAETTIENISDKVNQNKEL